MYQASGYGTANTQLATKETSFEKSYLPLEPTYLQSFDTWAKLFQSSLLGQ
jgi:hypothetical protein